MAKTLSASDDDLLKFLDQEPLGSRASMDDDDDDQDDDSSSSDDDDDDDDLVLIDGVLVKLRGDGSIDDSQPTGLIQTSTGYKLRGDGTIDDSQPAGIRIIGTPRNDKIIGTGIIRETLIGRRGSDDFLLGNRRDPFYLDSTRDRTYALLKDFSGNDEAVLHGSRSNYRITETRRGGVAGTGIFYKDGTGKDLIALIARKANPSTISLGFL